MSLSDKFLVAFVLLWLALTAAFFWVGLHVWGWLWLTILVTVGVAELASTRRTGRTLTQSFQDWALAHRRQAVLLLTGMAVAWGFLILHLAL